MENLLIVLSILSLQYPIGLFKDTARRYSRMELNNAYNVNYKLQNDISLEHGIRDESNPIYKFSGSVLAFISGLIFSLFPLSELLNVNWFFLIIINIAISLIIAPTLAFITTPVMTINSRTQLKSKTLIFSITGIILYALASII